MAEIKTDVAIVGAGPVGLFAVFELGLLKLRAHVMDVLPKVGGQLTEIYPNKPIYDIPGYPKILAGELIERLMEQIRPFNPSFGLGQRVVSIEKQADGTFLVGSSTGARVHAKAVIIAGGMGCFEPRKPRAKGLEEFENKGVEYFIIDPESFKGKRVLIAGGGDSALDWTIHLSDIAESLHLVHRRGEFRGAPDSAAKVINMAREGKIQLHLNAQLIELGGRETLEYAGIKHSDGRIHKIELDYVIPLFGLSPKLGPIAEWGIEIEKKAVVVDPLSYSTNIDGIYAIGDINHYPGKLKLILSGFHESAIAAHSIFKYIHPDEVSAFNYTTLTGIEGLPAINDEDTGH